MKAAPIRAATKRESHTRGTCGTMRRGLPEDSITQPAPCARVRRRLRCVPRLPRRDHASRRLHSLQRRQRCPSPAADFQGAHRTGRRRHHHSDLGGVRVCRLFSASATPPATHVASPLPRTPARCSSTRWDGPCAVGCALQASASALVASAYSTSPAVARTVADRLLGCGAAIGATVCVTQVASLPLVIPLFALQSRRGKMHCVYLPCWWHSCNWSTASASLWSRCTRYCALWVCTRVLG